MASAGAPRGNFLSAIEADHRFTAFNHFHHHLPHYPPIYPRTHFLLFVDYKLIKFGTSIKNQCNLPNTSPSSHHLDQYEIRQTKAGHRATVKPKD